MSSNTTLQIFSAFGGVPPGPCRATVGMGTGTVNGLIDIGQLLSVGLLDACDGDAGLLAKAETALDEAEVRDGLRAP